MAVRVRNNILRTYYAPLRYTNYRGESGTSRPMYQSKTFSAHSSQPSVPPSKTATHLTRRYSATYYLCIHPWGLGCGWAPPHKIKDFVGIPWEFDRFSASESPKIVTPDSRRAAEAAWGFAPALLPTVIPGPPHESSASGSCGVSSKVPFSEARNHRLNFRLFNGINSLFYTNGRRPPLQNPIFSVNASNNNPKEGIL